MFVYSGDPISQSKLKIYPNNILPTKKEKVHHRRQLSRSTTMQSGHHHHGHPEVLPVFHALENIPTISTETRGYFPQGPNFVFPTLSLPINPSPTYYSPKPFRTSSRTLFSYSFFRSRQIFAASTFAGLSSLGSASILITEIRIFSTL